MNFNKTLWLLIYILSKTNLSVNCALPTGVVTNDILLRIPLKKVADPKSIIERFGYPAETHRVVTSDGYVLTLHRIPRGKNIKKQGGPVLVMHGLIFSSANFVNISPNVSLGYILADEGYDVWIGNARGNSYSNKHTRLDPYVDAKMFYNFSWHEIGVLDLPASIDYILGVTKQKKLYYIGHSQGCTAFLVMASVKPNYNEKIRIASLMGPAAYISNIPAPFARITSEFHTIIQNLMDLFGVYHIPFLDLIRGFLQELCKNNQYFDSCKEMFYLIGCGYEDDAQIGNFTFPEYFRTTPSDASSKQFIHYMQGIKSGKFQQFDYGPEGNIKVYGTNRPLDYNISSIKVPIALYYGKNDKYVSAKDVLRIVKTLPLVVNNYLIPYENFNHGDFLHAKDTKILIYNELIRIMKQY